MNYFTSFLTAVCASAVFIGALYMICPDGVMNKSVTYILGLVFILCVTSASGVTVKNIQPAIPTITETEDNSEEGLRKMAEIVYGNALKTSGIEFSKITVCTNKSKSGSISISKIEIISHSPKDKIIAALGQVASAYEVEIINE